MDSGTQELSILDQLKNNRLVRLLGGMSIILVANMVFVLPSIRNYIFTFSTSSKISFVAGLILSGVGVWLCHSAKKISSQPIA